MNDDSIIGGVLNQLGQTAKQTVKQVIKIPEEMAQDAAGQVGVKKPAASAEGSGEPRQWQSDEERIKFLKDLYGSAEQNPSEKSNLPVKPSADASAFVKTTADKKAMADKEEQKKLIELRNKLHKENYYDPLFNRPQKQEERPAEKVEQEKKQEMMELQQKDAKKPPPLAVVREQNKAEMFRGAAG